MGQRLFRRNGRQVHLTGEGAALLPRVQRALEDLERAVDDVRLDRLAGPLRVTTLTSFLQMWLLPRMVRFRAAHPEIDLHVHTSADMVDFVQEDFHLAIRFGMGNWPNLRAEKLLDEWLLPVCTPDLHASHGPVRTADDLKRYPLVHSVSEPWTAWLFDGRADPYAGGVRGAVFEDSESVVRMAVQGAGLALVRWSLAADEIHCGTLSSPPDVPCNTTATTGWSVRPGPRACKASERSWTGSAPRRICSRPRGMCQNSSAAMLRHARPFDALHGERRRTSHLPRLSVLKYNELRGYVDPSDTLTGDLLTGMPLAYTPVNSRCCIIGNIMTERAPALSTESLDQVPGSTAAEERSLAKWYAAARAALASNRPLTSARAPRGKTGCLAKKRISRLPRWRALRSVRCFQGHAHRSPG